MKRFYLILFLIIFSVSVAVAEDVPRIVFKTEVPCVEDPANEDIAIQKEPVEEEIETDVKSVEVASEDNNEEVPLDEEPRIVFITEEHSLEDSACEDVAVPEEMVSEKNETDEISEGISSKDNIVENPVEEESETEDGLLKAAEDIHGETAEKLEEELTEDDFTLLSGNIEARLGVDPTSLIDEISQIDGCKPDIGAVEKSEFNPECIEYSGKEVSVRSINNENGESICAVFVDTDKWETKRGVKVGDSVNDVFSKYGNKECFFKEKDLLCYVGKEKDRTRVLLFQLDVETSTVYSMAIVDGDSTENHWK